MKTWLLIITLFGGPVDDNGFRHFDIQTAYFKNRVTCERAARMYVDQLGRIDVKNLVSALCVQQ